jgi:hypothetical protein
VMISRIRIIKNVELAFGAGTRAKPSVPSRRFPAQDVN